MKCTRCDSMETIHDSVKGVQVCIKCGHILESNTIVSELQFTNSSAAGVFIN